MSYDEDREFEDHFGLWLDEIYKVGEENNLKKCIFSMSEIPVDKLNDVAIEGTVTFKQKCEDFWGDEDSRDYEKTMTNPTYLDIWKAAEDMIYSTRDFHHVFLEAFCKRKDGTYWFSMGS